MSIQSTELQKPKPPIIDLPLAVITFVGVWDLRATFEGKDFAPPISGDHWTRAQLGELLDALTLERQRTVRVEFRECDGKVFTEIIHAKCPDSTDQVRPRLVELTGRGFIPGEAITVALPVAETESNSVGVARSIVDLDKLLNDVDELLLVGRISGNIVTERLS